MAPMGVRLTKEGTGALRREGETGGERPPGAVSIAA